MAKIHEEKFISVTYYNAQINGFKPWAKLETRYKLARELVLVVRITGDIFRN